MNRELEMQLRRDARAAERDVPESLVVEMRDGLEREGAPEFASASSHARPFLLAAAILVLTAAIAWTLHAAMQPRAARQTFATPGSSTPAGIGSGLETPPSLALSLPSHGMALAARAGEPLSREWQHMKSDSFAFMRELKRQLPPLALGE